MEESINIATVAGFVRATGAWLVLTTLVLTFDLQLSRHIRELQAAGGLAAEICIQTVSPDGFVGPVRVDTKPTNNSGQQPRVPS